MGENISTARLIPQLPELEFHLQIDNHRENYSTRVYEFEKLRYSLATAFLALKYLIRGTKEVAERLAVKKDDRGGPFADFDGRAVLGLCIDGFLSSIRKAQDATIPYIQRKCGPLSLPPSFNDLMKGIEKSKWSLDKSVVDLLEKYWKNHGEKLKAYRDLSVHRTLVFSEILLNHSTDGRYRIHFLLPNNPEVRKPSEIEFGKPPIHAIDYARIEFSAFRRLAQSLTDLLLPHNPLPRVSGEGVTLFKSTGTIGKPISGIIIPDENVVYEDLELGATVGE